MESSKKNTLLMVLWLTAALTCAVPSLAATIIVDTNGNTRFSDIQSAIDMAQTGDIVLIKPGEYAITEPITFRGKAITVRGERGPQETTVRAAGNQSWYIAVVLFENGEDAGSILEGLTLTGSLASGVFCVDSSPCLENCVITANYLCGVECLSSSPTITHCTVSGSVRDSGVNCRDRSAPTITHCSIMGNSAMGRGGGGVYCNDSSPNIISCIISGNRALSSGGGGVQCIRNSSLTLINCSISGNSAGEGGGVDCISSSLTLTNCIVWDNAGGAVSVDGTSNAQVTFSCIEGNDLWLGLGNINADPRFTYLGIFDLNRVEQVEIGGSIREFPDYIVEVPDYHLLPGSPGINAGTAQGAPQTDLQGNARLCDGRVDMGAYEMGDCSAAQVSLPLRGESGEVILGLGTLEAAVYSPDSKHIATSGSLGVFLWDAQTGALLHTFDGGGHRESVTFVVFSPDGTRVLAGVTRYVDRWREKDTYDAATLWDGETGQQIHSFRGLSGIRSVVFSPDGTRVVTVEDEGQATLWDVDTGQEIHNFGFGRGAAAAFSPDGTRVLTGSRDAPATLWDAHTGQEIRTFSGSWHLGEITSMVFSPDGTRVLTGSRDATAKLWDAHTGREIRTFRGGGAVAFSPDGAQVLGIDDGSATLWNAHTGQLIRALRGSSEVDSVAFSPDGTRVLTGSRDDTAQLWDADTGHKIHTLRGGGALAFSSDGTRVLTGSEDDTATLWDTHTGQEIRTFRGHSWDVFSVAFSPDGTQVLTVSGDAAKLWDAHTGHLIRTLRGHTAANAANSDISAAFSPDGTRVLTGEDGGTEAKLWDADTGQQIRTFSGHTRGILSVAFSPDGTRVLTGSGDDSAKLWDTETGQDIHTFAGHTNSVYSVAFSPDGTRVLTGAGWNDNTAKLWDAHTGQEIRSFGARGGVAFSPDGTQILTGGTLWDAETGQEIRTFGGHTDWARSVAFSPDGTQVLTEGGWQDDTATLWDAETGQVIRSFDSDMYGGAISVAFSPDGTRVLTGSVEGALDFIFGTEATLWDVETGQDIHTFAGHMGWVNSVAFSPDGKWVLTGSGDGTARIWQNVPRRLIYVDDDAPDDPGPGDPLVSDPLESGSPTHPMDSIQEAIDWPWTEDGCTILVQEGVYNEPVDFRGKAITVAGLDGAPAIEVPQQDAFTFHTGEGPHSVLKNFVIRESGMGIALNYGSSPTIRNLTLVDNDFGIAAYENSNPDISNCILWNNRDGDLFQCQARYSCIESDAAGIGNMGLDPLFVDASNGDYHLKSAGWFWNTLTLSWAYYDDVTSPCIDAGDPDSPLGNELLSIARDPYNEWGENLRINIGAYGGTSQASMAPLGWAPWGDGE